MKSTLIFTVVFAVALAVSASFARAADSAPLDQGYRAYSFESVTISSSSTVGPVKIQQRYLMGAGVVMRDNGNGTVQFKSDDHPGMEFTLKKSALLRAVDCEFRNRRAKSSDKIKVIVESNGLKAKHQVALGEGQALETFKDCAGGLVLFKPDSDKSKTFVVPSKSITLLGPPNPGAAASASTAQ